MNPASQSPAEAGLVRNERDGAVATLTLSSPGTRNALGLAMIEALISAFSAVAADPAIHVVVVAGDGRALSAGTTSRNSRPIATIPTEARPSTGAEWNAARS